jgi:NAD(P)-dependent dehydrogenase (short-subunit alcohol dehydrogenase family)
MAREPRSLSGKVAVVTGGGRGIGRALTAALAREGVSVAIGDVDPRAAQEAAAELGEGVIGLPLDVTDLPGYTAFLDEVEGRLGPIDILVNNAGIMPITPLADESHTSITRQIEINLRAVIHGTQEAVRRMRPRGRGHIVNVASLAGKSGYANIATYSATKHGVVGLSEAVRGELRGSGVEVSCIMPGPVKTELSVGLRNARGVKELTPEDVADEIVKALKAPRFDVYVPRSTGPMVMFASALPRRAKEAFARAIKADQAATGPLPADRAAYEARAQASAPAADRVAEVQEVPADGPTEKTAA